MAEIFIMTDEQKQTWSNWKIDRPQIIKDLSERFKPNHLYRHKKTNQKVIPLVFFENNTLEVLIPCSLNDGIFLNKRVFDVNPDDLEETELPDGMSVMSFEEYSAFID